MVRDEIQKEKDKPEEVEVKDDSDKQVTKYLLND